MAYLYAFYDTVTRLQWYREAKCIPALNHSSTRKIFNDSAWKKPKIYFFMRISISSNRLKFLTWKFLRKYLGTCSYKPLYQISFLSSGLKWNKFSKQNSLSFISLLKSDDTMNGKRNLVLVSPDDVWFLAWALVFQRVRITAITCTCRILVAYWFWSKNFIWLKL